ncbi:MAG: DsbA family protein [Pararhodobacter sp.]|nr:DsbA family protein [Pararhodobacter sp.]
MSRERATPVAAGVAPAAEAPADQTADGSGETDAGPVDTSRVIEMALGNPDAPVTIVEYSSFTCPHCATFNQGVFRQIMENYVDTGQVHFIKREVFFDAYGLWAALVARCGGPERYHGIVEMLYQDQRRWAGSNDGAEVAENLRRIGRRAGLDNDQLDACLADRDMATALMEVYRANAERYGIRSTPSFVINGQLHGNMSFADFQAAIASAAGE